jgi:glutathione peroxidase-family protein
MHPSYKWAAEARPKEIPRWNLHKYLIGRDGYIAEVFASSVEPSQYPGQNRDHAGAGGGLNGGFLGI